MYVRICSEALIAVRTQSAVGNQSGQRYRVDGVRQTGHRSMCNSPTRHILQYAKSRTDATNKLVLNLCGVMYIPPGRADEQAVRDDAGEQISSV